LIFLRFFLKKKPKRNSLLLREKIIEMLLENGILVSFVCLFLEKKKTISGIFNLVGFITRHQAVHDCICPKILI